MFFTEIWSRLICGSSKLFTVFSYLFWTLFFYYHSYAQWKTKKKKSVAHTHTQTHTLLPRSKTCFSEERARKSTNTKWNRLQWPTANATLRVLMMEVGLQSCDKGRATCGRADQLRLWLRI